MQLESGILVAVLVAAVLLRDRLGGSSETAIRLYQAALAISIVFLAFSATTAFVREHGESDTTVFDSSSGSEDTQNAADRFQAATAIHYAVGVGVLVIGMAYRRRYHTIPLGLVLGGVLLIFAAASFGGLQGYDLLLRISLHSSMTLDTVTFLAAGAGTVALLWYGFQLEQEFLAAEKEAGEGPGTADEPQ